MRVIKYLFIMLLIPALFACKKATDTDPSDSKADTYVSISLALPGSSLRALPDDYNNIGEWKGQDDIKRVDVFLVNETKGTVDYTTLNMESFKTAEENTTDHKTLLKPKKAIKATPGERVRAYVVINDVNEDIVVTRLKAVGAKNFHTEFTKEIQKIASQVSSFKDGKDVILMTNEQLPPEPNPVEEKITAEKALEGPNNQITVAVSRVVSRGIVTMASNLMNTPINMTNAQGKNSGTITLKSVEYSIGASHRKFFFTNKENYVTPEELYSHVPTNEDTWIQGLAYMDNSDLKNHTEVKGITPYDDTKSETDKNSVIEALISETKRHFVLPVTHEAGNYRKGNTTFFEIKATFVPSELYGFTDGNAHKVVGKLNTPLQQPTTVFLGLNDGKFYNSNEAAKFNGQKSIMYKNGIMKYVLWLNPNKQYGGNEKITESPTVRNHIYHAHISAFNTIGVPYNPLNPGTYTPGLPNQPKPHDPDYPIIPTPGTPETPETPDPDQPENPIKPGDPLQNEDTYLSVSIQVLHWGMHSYSVALSSDIY